MIQKIIEWLGAQNILVSLATVCVAMNGILSAFKMFVDKCDDSLSAVLDKGFLANTSIDNKILGALRWVGLKLKSIIGIVQKVIDFFSANNPH